MIYVNGVIHKALTYQFSFYDLFNEMKTRKTTKEGDKFFKQTIITKVNDNDYEITDIRKTTTIKCNGEQELITHIINMANICGCLKVFDMELSKTVSGLTLEKL